MRCLSPLGCHPPAAVFMTEEIEQPGDSQRTGEPCHDVRSWLWKRGRCDLCDEATCSLIRDPGAENVILVKKALRRSCAELWR